MERRTGEDSLGKTFFRSDRMSCINGLWFFSTREGSTEGPFDSRDEASASLALYIREQGGALHINQVEWQRG